MPDVNSWKFAVMGFTHLSKDALHVYVGLGACFLSALVFGWSLRGGRPWLAALAAALFGEIVDIALIIAGNGPPSWRAHWHDIWNTLFWPTSIFLLARFTPVLSRR